MIGKEKKSGKVFLAFMHGFADLTDCFATKIDIYIYLSILALAWQVLTAVSVTFKNLFIIVKHTLYYPFKQLHLSKLRMHYSPPVRNIWAFIPVKSH